MHILHVFTEWTKQFQDQLHILITPIQIQIQHFMLRVNAHFGIFYLYPYFSNGMSLTTESYFVILTINNFYLKSISKS